MSQLSRMEQARAMLAQGRLDAAKQLLQRVVQAQPRDADATSLLAYACLQSADVPRAAFYARRAAELRPDDAQLHVNLGRVLAANREHGHAESALRRAIALAPADVEAHRALSVVLAEQGRPLAAREACEAALTLSPGDRDLRLMLAAASLNGGRAAEAANILRELAAADPADSEVLSTLALTLNYVPSASVTEVDAAHRAAGSALSRAAQARPQTHPPVARAAGEAPLPLRVAIISPDLRTHSVAFFALPLLRHLDRSRFHVRVYYTNRFSDAMTKACRDAADAWIDMGTQSDEALAARLVSDGVHVALDLSGHTQGHSLGALAPRVAPLQATYLGYPNSTGLPEMDVRIVDALTDPPGSPESRSAERLARIAAPFLCFFPPAGAPPAALPEAPAPSAHVRLVSFNASAKFSDELFALWARVLRELPAATLRLKNVHLRETLARTELIQRFARVGGDTTRLTVDGPEETQASHLAAYHGADIALDTFPYHGTTTTLEALWMGVPVVTLAGESHASRVGVSILTSLGRSAWVASTPDEYVAHVAALAGDLAALRAGRAGLREALAASALCDGPDFGRRFGAALVEAWGQVAGNHA